MATDLSTVVHTKIVHCVALLRIVFTFSNGLLFILQVASPPPAPEEAEPEIDYTKLSISDIMYIRGLMSNSGDKKKRKKPKKIIVAWRVSTGMVSWRLEQDEMDVFRRTDIYQFSKSVSLRCEFLKSEHLLARICFVVKNDTRLSWKHCKIVISPGGARVIHITLKEWNSIQFNQSNPM